MRPVALLVNPSAGGGRAGGLRARAERVLGEYGVPFHSHVTRDLDDARALADRAAYQGEVVATLGGDGLAACAADVLRDHPDGTLALLPGGRGNDLARVLGLPRELEPAAALLARGVPRVIDLGEAAGAQGSPGRAFLGIASLGLDSVANAYANAAPGQLGRLVYAYGALRALAGWRTARFTLTVSASGRTERLELAGCSVAAANSGAYGGGMMLAPGARLDDGLLDVVTIAAVSRLRLLSNLPRVFNASHVHRPEVEVLRAEEVLVDAEPTFDVYADGDPIARTPVTLRALPGALRVLVAAA